MVNKTRDTRADGISLNPEQTPVARLRAELVIIGDDPALATACAEWRLRPFVALDSEFERSHTYYLRAALIQVYDGHHAWLIDAPKIGDWTPFGALLGASTVDKILHAGGEDVELFHHLGTTPITPLFDTQTAAAFCGHGAQRSYAKLVESLCAQRLAKSQTRSNWLIRPLSDAQIRYAIEDIAWLPDLNDKLRRRLDDRGYRAWADAETLRMVEERARPEDPERSYLRVRHASQLPAKALAVLASLATWRELSARQHDRPRRWIMDDETLVALATAQPQDLAALRALRRDQRVVTRHADALLAAIAAGQQREPPPAPRSTLHSRTHAATIKRLKAVVRVRAQSLDLPNELLAPARLVERLAELSTERGAAAVVEVLDDWRDQAVGDALRAELADC